ncbi:unnamed protein product [Linum tenue]|uniref:Ubiquitin carboxyl-terminal hydrolase n=1 Tax=Linum tenue TaxID=586396 RepID=A0AAV0I4V8_9ROSI|nr:unnamed protein product [Linum tenue]
MPRSTDGVGDAGGSCGVETADGRWCGGEILWRWRRRRQEALLATKRDKKRRRSGRRGAANGDGEQGVGAGLMRLRMPTAGSVNGGRKKFFRSRAQVLLAEDSGVSSVLESLSSRLRLPSVSLNFTSPHFSIRASATRFHPERPSLLLHPSPSLMTIMIATPLDQEDEELQVPHPDSGEVQPMEEAPVELAASTVEAQPVEKPPRSLKFTWKIENFARINKKMDYSDTFGVDGYKWRILIYPKGIDVGHLSIFLDVADNSTLPYGWKRFAKFSLAVVNQFDNKCSIRKDVEHTFNGTTSNWGFKSFMPLSDMFDPTKGYLVNDTLIVEAVVRDFLDDWSYDSKEKKGYAGLMNQGATCYMNSLLQVLYHIPRFKRAVYSIRTIGNDKPSGSFTSALQNLFFRLQAKTTRVSTKELTKSFGWKINDSFRQHDVQEFNRVLCEKLEDAMKGTTAEGTIKMLFEGEFMSYIRCLSVDYNSTRKEFFYDLQLDVTGCKDVYASFDKYVEVEQLSGDNRYHAEGHGLQINDRYEYPLQLDLDREGRKYLSPDADYSVCNLYTLHSVLVHAGRENAGHYYAFIRPPVSDEWYKFDDEHVTKEDVKRVLEEYGGEEEDANKRFLFLRFPPVLQLHLKRFEYDQSQGTSLKASLILLFNVNCVLQINDRYEYPLQLDLEREGRKYLSPDADYSVCNLYTLHSVLVHAGRANAGQYYAFIRPLVSDEWYKFDDEHVTKEDVKRVLEEYGGEEETENSNAYMLVYIRESAAVRRSDVMERESGEP